MKPGDRLIPALLTFVIVGAVVLVLGTGTLVWLLVQRKREPAGPAAATVTALPVPAGFRATSAALGDGRLLLFGTDAADRQIVVLTDPRKSGSVTVLTLEPR